MEFTGLMLTMILILVGSVFGTVIGILYKVDKLQKAVDELKRG